MNQAASIVWQPAGYLSLPSSLSRYDSMMNIEADTCCIRGKIPTKGRHPRECTGERRPLTR